MSWRRYDDKFERHPKVISLIEKAGYEAYYRLMRLHGYAAEFSTEGHLPKAAITDSGVKPKQLAAMIDVGLVDRDEQGTLTVHDWSDYNPKDPTNADRQKRYRDRNRNDDSNGPRNDKGNGESNGPRARASAPDPDARVPSRPEPDLLTPQTEAVSEAAGSGTKPSGLEQLGNDLAAKLNGHTAPTGSAERILELLDPGELLNGSEQRIRDYCDVLSSHAVEQARRDLENAGTIHKTRTHYVMGILERKARKQPPATVDDDPEPPPPA